MRELRRSRGDRMLGGVAAGIARTYGWDISLVRLGWVVAALLGIGIPAYIVAWIVIPPDDAPDTGTGPHRETSGIVGLALLGVGLLLFAGKLVPRGPHIAEVTWPLALIVGGVAILILRAGTDGDATPDAPRPDPAPWDRSRATPAPPPQASAPEAGTESPDPADPATETTTDEYRAPESPSAQHTTSAWTHATPWPFSPTVPRTPPRPPRPRAFLGPVVVSLLMVGAGVAVLLDVLDVVDVDEQVGLAIALGVVSAGLILSAFVGRARGLIALAVVLTAALTVLSIIDVPFEGGVGERLYHPTSRGELRDEYRLAMGQMTLDLRDLPRREGITDIEATVAMGEVLVQVPDDVTVEVHAEAGAGEVDVLGRSDGGVSVESDRLAPATRTSSTTTSTARLRLDLAVGFGHVKVDRYADDVVERLEGP
jgi:phage shock protein PspC (stress-responsive transcriptional regulator)